MRALSLDQSDGVAVLTLDLPGEVVNKLSAAVKEELQQCFEGLRDATEVEAVVFLSGKSEVFIAGADIEEFVALKTREEATALVRDGQAMLNEIAAFPKPVVVGIHGACLGAGLEFALAAHYRIATDHPKTQLGLPEVQLGILPAAGGCQRLPRLIGVRPALDLILTGRSIGGDRAVKMGLADEVVPRAILRPVAVQAARRLLSQPRARQRGGGIGALLDGNPLARSLIFAAAERAVRRRTGGHYPAPLAALDAVRHGLTQGMDEGMKREAELFGQLAVGDVSRKLVQIFFATTALKKDVGVVRVEEIKVVERLGVVGAGFMGAAIGGVAVSQAGVDVRLRDADYSRVAKGLATAQRVLDQRRQRRRLSRFEHRRLSALLSGTVDYSGFAQRDLVIEAVFEDPDVKRAVIAELERVVRDDCLIASNTSTIPIERLQVGARRPERVLGMHFFSPVEKMPLLEVISGPETAPWALASAVSVGRKLGKTVIMVRDTPGFWVNRLLAPYVNEAGWLLNEGVQIEIIDRVMTRFGFPVGPVTLLDEVGLDVAEKVSLVMHQGFGARLAPAPGLARLVQAGRLGRKNGRGFYRYRGGTKRGVDPTAYDAAGVPRGAGQSTALIEQRLVCAMLNEAARAAAEGVVGRPRDGDIGAIFGFGFPAFRGGPLRLIDDLGAARLVEDLQRLAERFGERFAPAEPLREMASAGSRFYP